MAPREDECFGHQPTPGASLNEREAMAICLAERIALDPHTVTDEFFTEVQSVFTDEEIVEMVFSCGIFNWGNKFNITMHMDADEASPYDTAMEYRQEALG